MSAVAILTCISSVSSSFASLANRFLLFASSVSFWCADLNCLFLPGGVFAKLSKFARDGFGCREDRLVVSLFSSSLCLCSSS